MIQVYRCTAETVVILADEYARLQQVNGCIVPTPT